MAAKAPPVKYLKITDGLVASCPGDFCDAMPPAKFCRSCQHSGGLLREAWAGCRHPQAVDEMNDFCVVVDTREQLPFVFSTDVTWIKGTLPAGDYSVRGYETAIALERKSLNDYVGSIITDRDRFLRECERLRGYSYAAIVVEGGFHDIYCGRYRSGIPPASIIGATASLMVDTKICVLFCHNRELAQVLSLKILRKFWEHARRDEQGNKICAYGEW